MNRPLLILAVMLLSLVVTASASAANRPAARVA